MRTFLPIALVGALFLVVAGLGAAFRDVSASTVEKLDLAGLFDRSEHVVHGRIAKTSVRLGAHGRPETTVELELTTAFWGGAQTSLVFTLPGGALSDGREMVIPGLPKLAVGEEVLLFLSRESKRGLRLPIGLAQGKFQIVRDEHGPAVLVRGASELEVLDPATKKSEKLETRATLDWQATVRELERLANVRREREAREKAESK
ncbi:MAG: hypothetical protein L6Q99_14890 [Planctomycetes bacterium]|nr:hypothetical protein [Planctomycetota bacterium]